MVRIICAARLESGVLFFRADREAGLVRSDVSYRCDIQQYFSRDHRLGYTPIPVGETRYHSSPHLSASTPDTPPQLHGRVMVRARVPGRRKAGSECIPKCGALVLRGKIGLNHRRWRYQRLELVAGQTVRRPDWLTGGVRIARLGELRPVADHRIRELLLFWGK